MKKVAYLAGDGLKKGNQILRNMERDAIRALDTVDLFNPWEQAHNDKSKSPTAEMIVEKDTEAILKSSIVIADIDNNSVGTTTEMGQIWGLNYMWDCVAKIALSAKLKDLSSKEIIKKLNDLLTEIPYKDVMWHTSDVRDTDILESGHRRSHSLNQYLHGLMLDMAGPALTFDEILQEIKNA